MKKRMKYNYLILMVTLLFLVGCISKPISVEEEVQPSIEEEVTVPDQVTKEESEEIVVPDTVQEENVLIIEEIPPISTINIIGKEGFFPTETRVKANESIVFKNQMSNKAAVITLIQKEGTPTTTHTKILKYGEEDVIVLKEPGTYKCWLLEYTPRCKIIVE
ncbi:MAG: hypothetical protein KKA62_01800 [Nanoarchaeota archaeon]|nr:hypothetical protein [Nanoarchaeota archaeon]MBU1643815.1 hypothetical protein [Nanoarchaeota archaeon]MBU1976667.1 hypothetical protein [Nanoarchaeota archaeon]